MTNELRGSGVTYGSRDELGVKTALDFLPNRPTTTTVQTVAISHNITAILKVKSQVLSHGDPADKNNRNHHILMISITNSITNITNHQILTIKTIK